MQRTARTSVLSTVVLLPILMLLAMIVGAGNAAAAATAPVATSFSSTVTACPGTRCVAFAHQYAPFFGPHTSPSTGVVWTVEDCGPPGQSALTFNNAGAGSFVIQTLGTAPGSYVCHWHATDPNTSLSSNQATFTLIVEPAMVAAPVATSFSSTVTACPGTRCVAFAHQYAPFFGPHTSPSTGVVWTVEDCGPPGQSALTFNNAGAGSFVIQTLGTAPGSYVCHWHATDPNTDLSSNQATFTLIVEPAMVAAPVATSFSSTVTACPGTRCVAFAHQYAPFFGPHTSPSTGVVWTVEDCGPPGQSALTFNNAGAGSFVIQTLGTAPGSYVCHWHATDPNTDLSSNQATFTLIVEPAAPAPPTVVDQTLTEVVSAGATDVRNYVGLLDAGASGTGLTFVIDSCSPPGPVTIDNPGAKLTVDLSAAATVACLFHASNADGTSNTATLTISIVDSTQVPLASWPGVPLAGAFVGLLALLFAMLARRRSN